MKDEMIKDEIEVVEYDNEKEKTEDKPVVTPVIEETAAAPKKTRKKSDWGKSALCRRQSVIGNRKVLLREAVQKDTESNST